MDTKVAHIEAAQEAIKLFAPEKTLREKLLELALSQVGITEFPSGTNCIKYNTWFYGREVKDGDKPGAKYPWCCTFICWLFDQVGHKLPVADYLRGWSSVPNLHAYAVKKNMITKTPRIGDLVIYKWGGEIKHIGLYAGPSKDPVRIKAVEGNTSFDDKGSQDNGGCVAIKNQNTKLVLDYINIDLFLNVA